MTGRRVAGAVLGIVGAAAIAACQPEAGDVPAGDVPAPAAAGVDAPVPAPGTCTLRHPTVQDLPDPVCTPGTTNPAVTQASITDTICKTGWTTTVRPSTSVTGKLKTRIAAAYSLPAGTEGELDHLVSLELGGAPTDPANLWVEPGRIPNPKDTVENQLHAAVCTGLIPLTTAQKAIAGDWTTAFDTAGLQIIGSKECLQATPTKCVGGRRGDEDGG